MHDINFDLHITDMFAEKEFLYQLGDNCDSMKALQQKSIFHHLPLVIFFQAG